MRSSTLRNWLLLGGLAGLLMALSGTFVLAQETPTAPPADTAATPATPPPVTVDSVNAKADAAALAGNNAWMLTSSALVLFMTAPGLAMFYGGLVRKKNILSVMMQCLFLMCMMSVIWGLYGYSLAFGDPEKAGIKPYIGDGDFLFMKDVARSWPEGATAPVEPTFGTSPAHIPRLTHMLFQGKGMV